jgi:hypothetical protein
MEMRICEAGKFVHVQNVLLVLKPDELSIIRATTTRSALDGLALVRLNNGRKVFLLIELGNHKTSELIKKLKGTFEVLELLQSLLGQELCKAPREVALVVIGKLKDIKDNKGEHKLLRKIGSEMYSSINEKVKCYIIICQSTNRLYISPDVNTS